MKRFAIVVLALLIASGAASAETVDKIVATIDGEPVTLFELDQFREQQKARPGADADGTGDAHALLDELVLEKIMQKQIKSQGLTATDQQIDSYINSIRERNNLNEAQLKAALTQQGLTWDQYRAQVKVDIERASLINREIRAKVNVSPEEIERYYKAHLDQYGKPASVRVRLITFLVPTEATAEQKAELKEQAQKIREEAADGKDFAELAKKHSQGPGAEDGGDIGELARGQMQQDFEDAAFSLKPGQVSKVIETDSGYHILKVENQAGEAHRDLKDVSDEIRDQLYKENMEERYDRWLKQDLRARHHVEIML